MLQNYSIKSETCIFANSKKTKLYKKNEVIYSENDRVNEIYIILDGTVESTTSKNSKSSELNLQKGSSLGLIDTILDRPFTRKMKAKNSVSLAIIEKNKIKNLLTKEPFSGALIKSLVIDIDNKYPNTWS
jgi:CRP-like cAMP-binding protein